jgi:hypothetical protein
MLIEKGSGFAQNVQRRKSEMKETGLIMSAPMMIAGILEGM